MAVDLFDWVGLFRIGKLLILILIIQILGRGDMEVRIIRRRRVLVWEGVRVLVLEEELLLLVLLLLLL